eukprot:2612773-Karenia_brevis.AAC.1
MTGMLAQACKSQADLDLWFQLSREKAQSLCIAWDQGPGTFLFFMTTPGVPDPPDSPIGSEVEDNGSQYGNQH